MKNLDLIKEAYVKFDERNDIRELLIDALGSDLFYEIMNYEFKYWFVSYLNLTPLKLIYCDSLRTGTNKIHQRLSDILQSQNPKNFNDLLFIVTFYNPMGREYNYSKRDPFEEKMQKENNIYDDILSESGGFIAYHHQIESLYRMLTRCSPCEANKFRKDLWSKHLTTWEESRELKFADGKSLFQLMEERMFGEFTRYPDYSGAYNLYTHCFG